MTTDGPVSTDAARRPIPLPVGVVVVTHGQLAPELVNAAEAIVGDLANVSAVSIGWHDDVDQARAEIARAIEEVATPAGTLVLSGANTYLGQTIVNAGVLVAASNSALGSSLGIAIEWRDSAFNVGVDNIDFTVGPAAVPEPSTGALLLMGGLALIGRWSRRRHGK